MSENEALKYMSAPPGLGHMTREEILWQVALQVSSSQRLSGVEISPERVMGILLTDGQVPTSDGQK